MTLKKYLKGLELWRKRAKILKYADQREGWLRYLLLFLLSLL